MTSGRPKRLQASRVSGDQPKRPFLAGPPDEDRDGVLDGSGITDQLGCGERGARERRRPLAPEEREHAKRVFQLFVTGRDWWERDPVALMLLPIPSDAQTKVHPAPGKDIQRGHRLPQDHRMSVPDPGNECPQPDPAGDPRQECKRGVGLGNVLPLAADLGDLTEVVHHPQVVESGRFCPRGDGGKTGRHLGSDPRPSRIC